MKQGALCIVAVLAFVGCGQALGAEPAGKPANPGAKPTAAAKRPKPELICTTQAVAGSLIPRRVCETQQQIDAQRQASQDLNSERREQGSIRAEALGMTPSGPQDGR